MAHVFTIGRFGSARKDDWPILCFENWGVVPEAPKKKPTQCEKEVRSSNGPIQFPNEQEEKAHTRSRTPAMTGRRAPLSEGIGRG